MSDVGKPKATVAAQKIMDRIDGVHVTPHFCRIEEKEVDFYRQFQIIVLGLDSLEARSYINSIVCGFLGRNNLLFHNSTFSLTFFPPFLALEYDEEGELDQSSIKPMIDGGTEGFKGHSRVILPGISPCFHCTLWLFPPQVTFPLCTLAETPRSPAHCIEYAHLIQWGQVTENQ